MLTSVCTNLIGASLALRLTFIFALDCANENEKAKKDNNKVKILFILFVLVINNLKCLKIPLLERRGMPKIRLFIDLLS